MIQKANLTSGRMIDVDGYYIDPDRYIAAWEDRGSSSILNDALSYAERHWEVFPAHSSGEKKSHKSAAHSNGRNWGKTTDLDEIRRDFQRWPDANVGIVTGPDSAIFVVEADTPEGHDVDGIASLQQLEVQYGPLPETLTAESPSGSVHRYFKWPVGISIRNSTSKIAPGVDVLGNGGMVIAPPSLRPGKGYYRWLNEGAPVSEAPQWLIDLATVNDGGAEHTPNENLRADPELIAAAMAVVPNADESQKEYNNKGMAIWAATGGTEQGFQIFDTWARKSKKYHGGTYERWGNYKKYPPNRIGAGSIIDWANAASPGWQYAYDVQIEAAMEAANRGALFASEPGADGKPQLVIPGTEQQPAKVEEPQSYALDEKLLEKIITQRQAERPATKIEEPPPKVQQQPRSPKPSWRTMMPFIDVSRWDDEPVPPQDWAVPDRIPLRNTTLFSGEGAAGKSLIQLQASVAHVLGRDWLGTTPVQGPAVFIDAEDEVNVIHKRLADILKHYGAKFADVKDSLHLVSLAGQDAILGVHARRSNRIEPTPLYASLLQMAGDLKPKMIGIASSADVFAGSEIDRSQVKQFVAMLTRLAIVANGGLTLIAHPSLTGISTGTGLSGTTQWHNSVRARFYLESVRSEKDDNQPDTNVRKITFKKNNYGPISSSVGLQYRDGLFLPIEGANVDAAARSELAKDVFLTILHRFLKENRKVSANRGPSYGPSMFAEEQEAKDAGCTKEQLAGAMRTLLQRETIVQEQYGKQSNPHYRLVLSTGNPGPM